MLSPGAIWVVPGFAGSELYLSDQSGGRTKLWLDLGSLLAGSAAPNLVWGQTPAGSQVVVGGLLDAFGFGYGSLVAALQGIANSNNYRVWPWPYDWRQGALALGQALYTAIVSVNAPDNKIICHSYGSCVVQAAMALLKLFSQDGMVSTILSLGSVFSGSYATCRAWREEEDSMNHLAIGTSIPAYLVGGFTSGAGRVVSYKRQLLTAFVSWPATYDLLPDPNSTDDPGDTNRHLAWNAGMWSAALVPPTQPLMDASTTGWQSISKTTPYILDSSKWLTISGRDGDNQTPWRMTTASTQPAVSMPTGVGIALGAVTDPDWQAAVARRQQLPGLSYSPDGDNRSMRASQTRPGVQNYGLRGAHADLPTHPTFLSLLPQLLFPPGGSRALPAAAVPYLAAVPTPLGGFDLALNWPEHATP